MYDVLFCTALLQNNVAERNASSTDAGVKVAAVVIPTVLVIIIVTLVVAISVWLHLHTKITEEFTIDKMTKAYQAAVAKHPLFDRVKPLRQAGPHKKEFSSENVTFVRELGEGVFGRVYQGIATNIIAGEDSTVVAIKQLKLNTTLTSDDNGAAVVDFFKG